jgi:tetratricopeptide (TPR) repeat protein
LLGLAEYQQALSSMDASCAVGDHIGNGFARARKPNVLGTIRYEYCDYQGARSIDEEGIEISRALGFKHPEISGCINVGRDLIALGELDAAQDMLDNIRRRVEREGDGSHRWRFLLRITLAQAELQRALGSFQEARHLSLEALSLALKTGSLKYVSLSQLEAARAALSLNEEIAAAGHLAAAAEVARSLDAPYLHYQIEPLLAQIREKQKRSKDAHSHKQNALEALDTLLDNAPDPQLRQFLAASSLALEIAAFEDKK